jgi:hypothetical protein
MYGAFHSNCSKFWKFEISITKIKQNDNEDWNI